MPGSMPFDQLPPLHPHPVELARAKSSVDARGVQTSEFWIIAFAVVAPVALTLAGVDRRRVRDVAIGGGIAAAAYAIGRSLTKTARVRH